MKIFYIIFAAGVLLLCLYLGAQGQSTQSFEPARYALLGTELSISNVVNSDGKNLQKCVLKLDTRTGEVWLLQAAVNGPGDPTVRSAVWSKVSPSGTFYPMGNPGGQ